MRRGEVWWVEHPKLGRRPYLVMTRDTAIPLLTKVMAVPATSTIRRAPSEMLLDEDDGMPRECVINFDNVTTIPKSMFATRICDLNGERLVEACATLNRSVGC